MSGDNPFDVTSGAGSRGGPATNAYVLRNSGSGFTNFLDQIEGKSDARQAELLGATPGYQREQTVRPRYEDWMQVPNVAEGVPTPDERGIISRAFDYLLRPGSAAMGFATGFLGLNRYAPDVDQLGNQAVPGNRYGTALSRARQGLSGETHYKFADFTPVARKKSEGIEVPLYQNTANVGAGFVVDTVFDPLTYVSFGGNLYGRRLGSKYVGGRVQVVADDVVGNPNFDPYRFLQQTYDSGRASAITPAALAAKADRLRQQVFSANLISDPVERAILANADLGPNQTLPALLSTIRKMSTKEVDFAREIAREWLPDAAMMQYWTGSARGLRKWLIRTMGMDEGMDFYRALPVDIQGGLRIRVPFVRTGTGDSLIPEAYRLVPGGGGQIAESLSKRGYNQMENFLDLTEAGRDVVRSFFVNNSLLSKLFVQGRFSNVAYDAIVSATGKNVRDGRTAFVTYGDFERANWRNIVESNMFNTRQAAIRAAANESFGDAVKELPVEEQRAVARQAFVYMSDRKMLEDHINNPSILSPLERKALEPATIAIEMLDQYGREAVELGIDVSLLNNFAPRMKTAREKARIEIERDSFSRVGGGKASALKAPRDAYVFEWKYDMYEGAKVARWDIAPDIKKVVDGEWENPFIGDFITALFTYADDMTQTLDSWRLAKIFSESGAFTRKQVADLEVYNRSLIERDINELVGQGREPGALVRMRKQIIDEFFEDESADRSIRYQGTIREKLTPARGRALGEEWSETGIQDTLRRADFDKYESTGVKNYTDKRVAEYYTSGVDNSSIARLKDGTFELISEDGRVLSKHTTFAGAVQESADIHLVLRDGKYNNYIVNKMYEILDKIDDLLYLNIGQANIPLGFRVPHRVLGMSDMDARLNMRYGLYSYINELPPAEALKAQEVLNRRTYELVRYFGRDMPDIKLDKYGNFVSEGDPRLVLKKSVKDDFRKWVHEESWADLANQIYLPDGTINGKAQRVVQQRVLARMEEVYAPRAVMDAYTRMVEVVKNPNSFEKTVWQPTYTALRSSMTLWRGFGFPSRNFMGGAYNGTLYGIGVQHHVDAGKLLRARYQTRLQILEKYGDRAYQDAGLEQEMIDTFKKNLNVAFKGSNTYVPDTRDADAMFEIWTLGYNADLLGGSRRGRVMGDLLLNAPFQAERMGPASIQRPFDRRGQLSRFIDIEKATGQKPMDPEPLSKWRTAINYVTPTKEKWGDAMQYVAMDNWWVRRVMGPTNAIVEDQLRLAAFLKGVQDVGLEPVESGIRGFSASTLVKITQFDYTDLSPWELRVFKNLMPFWVWTRNNVPLQVRASINNPRKIARYARGLDAVQSLFQEDYKEPVPTYAENQFSIFIDQSYWDGAPAFLKPLLPKGTVAVSPFPWLDPLVDLNRWLRLPKFSNMNPVNWPELSNNINPIINGVAELLGGMSAQRDYAGRDYRDAPRWQIATGMSEPDTSDPSRRVSSQKWRNVVTNLIPQMSLLERYFPFVFGDQRQRDKWMTTMVSAMTGITIVTIDDLQVSGQMTRDVEQVKWYTDRKWGPSANFRIDMIRTLLDEGAPLWFIQGIDIDYLPSNELDVARAVRAWELYRGISDTYNASVAGIDDPEQRRAIYDEIIRPYTPYFSDEDKGALNLVTGIWGSLENFRGDFYNGVRAGAWQPVTNAEIRAANTNRNQITRLIEISKNENKSDEEREAAYLSLMEIYDTILTNRNIGRFSIYGEKVKGWKPDAE